MIVQKSFQALGPAAQRDRAAGECLAQVVFDVQDMGLTVGQQPGQLDSETMVSAAAIGQGQMALVAGHAGLDLAFFAHNDLHVPMGYLRIPTPAAEAQSTVVPDLGSDGGWLVGGLAGQLQAAWEQVGLVGDLYADPARVVQPGVLQLYGKAVELISRGCVGLELIGSGQGHACAVYQYLDHQARIRLGRVQGPTL
ncbi:hypothetical protein [Pseudomonas sp. NPDC087336]|uniref:hypothetical protein n=1 Tax=unclassified Pseudomonas TaxID=196821 RepID=UPI003804D147